MPGAYESMSEAANARPEKGNMMVEPEESLAQIMNDLQSGAHELETEACDLENRMLLCRARAAALRTAAGGVEAALERFREEMHAREKFMANRDGEDVPESKYDARAHANRMP